jgi:hypothetical protein
MEENAMHQNQSAIHHQLRQRKIDFAEESLWPSFAESCQQECRRFITQLLVEVIHREHAREGGVDERED